MQRTRIEIPQVRQCFHFAWELCRKDGIHDADFGRVDLPRTDIDKMADIVEGKMAEVAVCSLLNEYDYGRVSPDFRIWADKADTDMGQDLLCLDADKHLRCRVDVKSTRKMGRWLLVERSKMTSDVYIIVQVDLPRDIGMNKESLRSILETPVSAVIAGYAYYFDFIENGSPKHLFKRGDRLHIPGHPNQKIGPTLKANANMGLPISQMRFNWPSLVEWIRRSELTEEEALLQL